MKDEVRDEFRRLVDNANTKRRDLLGLAARVSRARRRQALAAGSLALFSASSALASALAELGGDAGRKVAAVIAAVAALLSGMVSVFASVTMKDADLAQLFEGAVGYLTLRNRASVALAARSPTGKQAEELLTDLKEAYVKLDATYTRFLVAHGDGPAASTSGARPGAEGAGD